MAAVEMTQVGYNGGQYDVPNDVLQAGMAKQYIENEIAEKEERKAQREAQKQSSLESDFKSIKSKISKVDSLSERVEQLERSNAAYKAANQAQRAQIEALEDANGGLGSTSSKAREASLELSQMTAGSAMMIEPMLRTRESLQRQVEVMQERLDQLETRQKQQIDAHIKAGQTRQRLAQEEVNGLKDTVAKLEARAAKAEAVAARALRDAEAAQAINDEKGNINADRVRSIARDEMQESMPNAVEMAVETIRRDEFPNGFYSQRVDGERTRQLRKDATTFADKSYGGLSK